MSPSTTKQSQKRPIAPIAISEAGPSSNATNQTTRQHRKRFKSTNDEWDYQVRNCHDEWVYPNRRIMAIKCIKAILAAHVTPPVTIDITNARTDAFRLGVHKNTGAHILYVSGLYLWKASTTQDSIKHDIIPAITSLQLGWPHKSRPTRNRCDDAEWMGLARSLGWQGITDTKGQQSFAPYTYGAGTLRCSQCGIGPQKGRYRRSHLCMGECSCGGTFEELRAEAEADAEKTTTPVIASPAPPRVPRPVLVAIHHSYDPFDDDTLTPEYSPNLLKDVPNKSARVSTSDDKEEDSATQLLG